MMKVSEALTEAWRITAAEASSLPGYYRRRIANSGPVAAYAGVDVPGKLRKISIRLPVGPGHNRFSQSTRGYTVLINRADNSDDPEEGVYIVERAVPLPRDLFLIFSTDILENLKTAQTAAAAPAIVERRLEHWHRFFEDRSNAGLSREEYIGLYAELDFLERCLRAGIQSSLVVAAWGGPFGTNQDFLFGEAAVEVKATTANDPDLVRITNVRQLDDQGLKHLYLAHCAYDFRENHGRTLGELIGNLKNEMEGDETSLSSFSEKVAFAGAQEPLKSAFANYGFTIRVQRDYRVEGHFPRILERELAAGISEVAYSLHLSAAMSYRVEGQDLMKSLATNNE